MKVQKEAVVGVRMIDIGADHDGQRIDNFLASELKGVPKSHIYRILRRGEVRVNKGRIAPKYRLKAGDVVRLPPVRVADRVAPPRPAERQMAQIEQAILYEDDRLVVLNKPSGIAVHGGSGQSWGIIELLRAARPGAPSLELVHRVDKETSGCLMIAKKRSMLRALHEVFRSQQIDKRYLALLEGQWRGGDKSVRSKLRKNVLQSGERMVRVAEDGKEAESLFSPLRSFPVASLVEVRIMTGRTHQIRVQAADMGRPVAGDVKYGSTEFNRLMRTVGLKRLFLHAHSLAFRMPGTNAQFKIAAPLGGDLQQVLDKLEKGTEAT
ncbi:MAG: 23S rRNA pseudouridine synthase [Gammaproteobacteria bacterium]|nr:MAG: 23S rRNA pseudouridine synthase [Gammaproteobacteria bacterium]TND06850.1 MAG: 23S rRNA pseudouridine synthase [Gammaproteobacteria bacterium]